MAKLYFRYGAMGASKTANALIARYNYEEKGQKVLMVKPEKDDRDGKKIVRSRIGLAHECVLMEELSDMDDSLIKEYAAIIVDEAQFLTASQVNVLSDIVDFLNVPVLCYGLRTDFQTHLFEGSKRLMEISDVIEEIPTVCWCGKRAHMNTRIEDGEVIRSGSQVVIGGNEKYVSLCRKHYKLGMADRENTCKN